MNVDFSFIILTFNEELHLARILDSIAGLNAKTYVLDSGSTDLTLQICKDREIDLQHNDFINHPKQWEHALRIFNINTPWTICLDADQTLSTELYAMLENFESSKYIDIDGIYFNRKNYFQKQWIRHGGYYPMYLLKMFRTNIGYSDLTGSMDHRFLVEGKTAVWKAGHIIEENLKENDLSFWINKHNTYSSLVADEEYLKPFENRDIKLMKGIFGMPNDRKKFKKQIWYKLPRYFRPLLYFLYRLLIQGGIRDGKKGILFHFLQGFWFRIIIDMKIEERLENGKSGGSNKHKTFWIFSLKFLALFLIFYYFNITFISLTSPGGFYIPFFETYLNYIQALRCLYISFASYILKSLGYEVLSSTVGLSVLHHAGFKLIYTCLGYGIMSCFGAFALSIPKPFTYRYAFLFTGIVLIFILNTFRLVIIAIYYKSNFSILTLDHHEVFNILSYVSIIGCSYLYLNRLNHDY